MIIQTLRGEIDVVDVINYKIYPLGLFDDITIIKFRTKAGDHIMIPHFPTLWDAQQYIKKLLGQDGVDGRVSQFHTLRR